MVRSGRSRGWRIRCSNGSRIKALLIKAEGSPQAQWQGDTTRPPLHLAGYLRAESWNGRTDATFFVQDVAHA